MNATLKATALVAVAAALIAAPLSPAQAREFHHGGWDHDGWHHDHGGFGLGAAVGGLLGATVALATAPVRIVADAVEPAPAYYGQPGYYQQPVYQQPVYQQPVYAAPPPVYVQQPVYAYPVAYPAYGYYYPHRHFYRRY